MMMSGSLCPTPAGLLVLMFHKIKSILCKPCRLLSPLPPLTGEGDRAGMYITYNLVVHNTNCNVEL